MTIEIKQQSKPPNREKSRTRWFQWWILPTFYRQINAYLYQSFSKKTEDGIFSNPYYKASITLIQKSDKNTVNKYKTISLMNTGANSQQRYQTISTAQ